jgi:hypothetical protein
MALSQFAPTQNLHTRDRPSRRPRARPDVTIHALADRVRNYKKAAASTSRSRLCLQACVAANAGGISGQCPTLRSASAEFHNLLIQSTTVTVYTGRTRPDSLWGLERLRCLAPIPAVAAVSYSRSQTQPSRATSFGHRVCQFPLTRRRVRHRTGRQKAQSQRCAR